MHTPTLRDIIDMMTNLVVPFYQIKRATVVPVVNRPKENDAEHSWFLGLLACALASRVDPALNVGLISQFAAVHDIVEVYAGDTPVHGDAQQLATKAVREAKALVRLKANYGHFPWISQTLEAYNRQDTPEAHFVYALDKLLPILFDYWDQARVFREQKVTLEEYNQRLMETEHRRKAHSHPAVGRYYDELRALIDGHPEYFFIR